MSRKDLGTVIVGFVIGAVGSALLLDRGRADIVVLILGGLIAGVIWCVHLLRKKGEQR